MAYEVVMPQLGIAMESGRISRWLKQSGDAVAPGDILLEVESDKATIEVEAVAAGELRIAAAAGDEPIPVGQPIAYIFAAGEAESAPSLAATAEPLADNKVTALHEGPAPTWAARTSRGLPSSPAARRRARELGLDWQQAAGTGPSGRIKERDILALQRQLGAAGAAASHDKAAASAAGARAEEDADARISPLALQLAHDFDLDLAQVFRRFPDRRIQREHVEEVIRELVRAALRGGAASQPVAPVDAPPALRGEARRAALSGTRKLIAARMSESSRNTAPVTLTTEADATELVRLREALRQPGDERRPSYNVLLAKLAACALREHPELNASLQGDEIATWGDVNVGIAVDGPRGLVVPVLRDVTAKSIDELAREAEALLGRAREGKAAPDELTGGTFTITNLGAYEIDAFTPIINPPECAILGAGRLQRKPVFDAAGAVVAQTRMHLSLTFDHRLVDGAPAARFLQTIKRFVEQPYLWLAR